MIISYRLKYLIEIFVFLSMVSCSKSRLEGIYKDLTLTYHLDSSIHLLMFVNSEFCGPCVENFSTHSEISASHGEGLIFVICEGCGQIKQKEIRKKLKDFTNSKFEIMFIDKEMSNAIRRKLSLTNQPVALKKEINGKFKIIEYSE